MILEILFVKGNFYIFMGCVVICGSLVVCGVVCGSLWWSVVVCGVVCGGLL